MLAFRDGRSPEVRAGWGLLITLAPVGAVWFLVHPDVLSLTLEPSPSLGTFLPAFESLAGACENR